jgi:hypothetical protein
LFTEGLKSTSKTPVSDFIALWNTSLVASAASRAGNDEAPKNSGTGRIEPDASKRAVRIAEPEMKLRRDFRNLANKCYISRASKLSGREKA